MKKVISLLLSALLLLSTAACGASNLPPESQEPLSVVSEAPEPTPEPTATPSPAPEPTPEPTPVSEPSSAEEAAPALGFTNPLTGEPTETDISANRPIVAMLNTIKQALPQSSCGMADMLYEIPEEGGITRVMAVYQDITDIGNIGTIRSTREYYLFLAMGLDAIMIHAGCSDSATAILEETGYGTLDFMSHGSLYWRDAYRRDNVGTEHSLYTSSDNIQNYLADTTSIRTVHEEGFSYPYTFTEDGTPVDGEPAREISVSFSGYKQTDFVYDEATKTYSVFAYGDPYVDDTTDTQVAVTNVIVIPTKQSTKEGSSLQEFDLSSGTGYYACGGQYIPITWEKGDTYECLRFYRADGTPLDLGVGTSYICICGLDRPISFQ